MEGCWGKLSSEVKQAVCRKAALNLVLKEMIVSGWAGGVEGMSIYKIDYMSEEACFYRHDYEGVEAGGFGATAGFAFLALLVLAV